MSVALRSIRILGVSLHLAGAYYVYIVTRDDRSVEQCKNPSCFATDRIAVESVTYVTKFLAMFKAQCTTSILVYQSLVT
jgi:hypothetical protein